MKRFRLPVFAFAAIATVAACDRGDPVANDVNASATMPASNEITPAPAGAPPANGATPTNNAEPAPAAAAKIPAALHGRWGMNPADCTTTRGDDKGLLTISEGELRFYESRAVPTSDVQSGADTVSGTFNFSGEGQTWTRFQSLQLRSGKLIRTETNPGASYTYAKCD